MPRAAGRAGADHRAQRPPRGTHVHQRPATTSVARTTAAAPTPPAYSHDSPPRRPAAAAHGLGRRAATPNGRRAGPTVGRRTRRWRPVSGPGTTLRGATPGPRRRATGRDRACRGLELRQRLGGRRRAAPRRAGADPRRPPRDLGRVRPAGRRHGPHAARPPAPPAGQGGAVPLQRARVPRVDVRHFKAGLVPVNTNYRYADDELVYLWDNADGVAVVFHGTFTEHIERIRDRVPGVTTWLWVDDGDGPCPELGDALRGRRQGRAERVVAPVGPRRRRAS